MSKLAGGQPERGDRSWHHSWAWWGSPMAWVHLIVCLRFLFTILPADCFSTGMWACSKLGLHGVGVDYQAHPSVLIYHTIIDNTMTIYPLWRFSGRPPDYTQWAMESGPRSNIESSESRYQPIRTPNIAFRCYPLGGKQLNYVIEYWDVQ